MRPPNKRVLGASVVALLAIFCFTISKTGAHHGRGDSWKFSCKPGLWGNLECVHIAVEMPEAFASLDAIKEVHAHWFFKDQNREEVVTFLKSADLTEGQLETLTKHSKWEASGTGFWVSPPDSLVLSISREARQKIYSLLAKFPENEDQSTPLVFRAQRLQELLRRSQLQESTIGQFNDLLYTKGDLKLFADTDIVVNHLPDEREKIRFLKTVSRVSTLLVKLRVDENSPIEELVDYWGYGGRKKDVRALLESMAAVPGGSSIDVAHLLPTFLRQHIYTYPPPENTSFTNRHCHWTSMNFLNDTPDDRFTEENFVKQRLGSDFLPVQDPPRLGDIFFFMAQDGSVLHSATFIADDIVFTKNGGAANRPWIYMQMEDLIACYMKPEEPLQIMRVRRKQI